MQDVPKFSNLVRSKLMKRGGVGYIEPDAGSFPKVEEFHQLITDANALPCITWLDGTSEGEKAIQELADLLIKKGAVALNIVPDRNWNIADPKVKEIKVRNLYQVVELARDLDLPINMGTEMNSFGQKLVDDFDAPELEPVKDDFIDGAYFIYGHTLMERAIRKGYQSEWAQKHLVSRKAKNHFYNKLGRCVQPGVKSLETLKTLDNDHLTPDDVLSHI